MKSEIIDVPVLGIKMIKTQVTARTRVLKGRWIFELSEDEIRDRDEEDQVQKEIDLGAFWIERSQGVYWDRYEVKDWMENHLEGKWSFSWAKCAFELEKDSVLFALRWL